jgi:hypothetical protein
MRAKIWGYVAVFGPLLLVSACVAVGCEMYQDMRGDPDDLPEITVSQTDAIHRMDELVHELLDLLPPQARPASRDGMAKATVDDNCEIGMEKKRSGQIHVSAGYQVFDLAPESFAEYFESLAEFARERLDDPQRVSAGNGSVGPRGRGVLGRDTSQRSRAFRQRDYDVHLAKRPSFAQLVLVAPVTSQVTPTRRTQSIQ